MKYIFVDLDETLFHSQFLSGNRRKAERMLRDGDKLIDLDTEFYGSMLRPGALDLLKSLRAIPDSKVLVLTASVTDYAEANNKQHGLGFDNMDIFARSHLESGSHGRLETLDLSDVEVYMIDNLPRQENPIKTHWLGRLTDIPVTYITVPDFVILEVDPPFDADRIEKITSLITAPRDR